MKKRFILLIDFSEYSGNLIRYAYGWSIKVNAELLLVHQTTVLATYFSEHESKHNVIQHTNDEALQRLIELSTEHIPSAVNVSFSVSEAHIQLTISKLLEEPFDNLIFAGLKGTGLLKKLFIGSVVLQIIENINNTVVAIPKEIAAFSPKKMFVAVAENHPLNLLGLNNLLAFIDSEQTSITFFHLLQPNENEKGMEKHLKELTTMFSDRYTTNFEIFESNNPHKDIKKVIKNRIDEILVVQKGSRLLTDIYFRKLLINDLVYEGQTTLIVLP